MKKYILAVVTVFVGILTSVAQLAHVDSVPTNQTKSTGWDTKDYESYKYTRYVNSAQQVLPFRLLRPLSYKNFPSKKYPLIIMLHGRGEAGTDNNYQLYNGGKEHLAAVKAAGASGLVGPGKFDGFVVFPQEPYGQWTNGPNFSNTQLTTSLSQVHDLVDSLVYRFRIDPERVVIHGLSSGGSGTWASLYHRPELFAAALPMSTPGDVSQMGKVASIPIWLFQGALDNNPIPYVSQQVMKALRDSGAVSTDTTRYTEYANVGHPTWVPAYAEPDFFPYILRFRKNRIMVLSKNPFCPGESVTLGFSAGFTNYQWYRNGVPISGANSNRLKNITDDAIYSLSYKARSNSSSLTYTNTVHVYPDVFAPQPSVTADQSLILPSPSASKVILSGPAGYVLYQWSNGVTTQQNTITNSGTYSLKVKQANGCLSVASANFTVKVGAMGSPLPTMPVNIKAIPVSPSSVLVTWDDVSDETGYEIYRSSQSNSGYSFVKLVAAGTSSPVSFTDIGLTPSTGYYYKVRSINAQAATLSSSFAYVETFKDVTLPTIPQNLSIYGLTPGKLTLIWNKSTDAFPIKKYTVYSGDAVLGSVTDTSFIFSPLSFSNTYTFSVEAEDYSGNKSGKSNIVPFLYNGVGLLAGFYIKKDPADTWQKLPDFTQLVADRQVVVSIPALSSSGVATSSLSNLNFVSVLDYFALRFTGYIQAPSSGKWTFYNTSDDGARLTINNQVIINKNAPQGAVEDAGTFTFANNTTWYPFTYEYFEVAGGQSLDLKWMKPSGNGGSDKVVVPTGNFSFLGVNPSGSLVFPVLSNYNGMTATEVTSTSSKKVKVTISFTSAPNSNIKSFELYRSKGTTYNSTTVFTKIADITRNGNSQTITYLDSNSILPSTTYYYAIKVFTDNTFSSIHFPSSPFFNGKGGGVKVDVNSTTITAPTLIPTLKTATGVSNSIIRLTFINNCTNNNCPNESGIEIWKSQDPVNYFTKVGGARSNDTSFTDNTGVINTLYYYKIRAYNSSGTTGFSNVLSTTTLNIPNAPSNLKVAVTGPKHLNLSWQNNSISSGYGFSIYKSTALNGTYSLVETVPNPGLTFYQDTSTVLTQKYYFKVRAYNDNVSAFSNIDSASVYTPVQPVSSAGSLTDWKMPVTEVTNNFKTTYTPVTTADPQSSTTTAATRYQAFKNNIPKLKTALEAKQDFLKYLYIEKGDSAYFQVKLPSISEMPYGGLITFNIGSLEIKDYYAPDSSTLVDEDFVYKSGSSQNYPIIRVLTSTDGTNFSLVTNKPNITNYSNDLNKVDITTDMADKYLRIMIKNFSSNSLRGGFLVSEIGAYRFLGNNVRHNYFLICGASVEKLHPLYMGLTQFRKQFALSPDLSNYGKDALIFNISKSGRASKDLRDSLSGYLAMHPKASYVIVHQGGNDINDSYNNMRPLTYPKLQTLPNAKNFIDNFAKIIKMIQDSNKVALISRMHFRDYKETCQSTGTVPGGAANNAPGVARGQKQENGSLPLNLLLDSLTKLYTPYAYNFAEKRSSINFYPLTLNNQDILGGDGIHPNSQINRNPYSFANYRVDSITNYWINYTMRYVYTGKFAKPVDYSPGGISTGPNAVSVECGISPSNKPNLLPLTIAAVQQAEKTKSAQDIWDARILVEQLGNKSTRIPYVNRLDSLRDYRSPANPTYLSANVLDGVSVQLSWLDNDVIETGYEVWKSVDNGLNYTLESLQPANTGSYTVMGLNGSIQYTFYVRAANGYFKSGWSNTVTARPGVTYYSKSSGDITSLATWGRNDDGTGTVPTNFTNGNQVYVFANRPAETVLSTNWSVSGTYSKVVLGQGTKLQIASLTNVTAVLDLNSGSQLKVVTDSIPDLNTIDSASTLIVSGNSRLKNRTYGTLKLDNSGLKLLAKDTVDIKGNLILEGNITLKGRPTVLRLSGDLIMNDTLPVFDNINLVLLKNTHQIDLKGGDLSMNSLSYKDSSTISVLNGSVLRLGSASGGGLLPGTNSSLVLGGGTLNIQGNGALNPSNKVARISSYLGSISINSAGALDSYIYPSISNYSFKNITLNIASGRSLFVKDSLKLSNTLKLKSGIINTAGNLILASDQNGTARISKVESAATFTGNIKWQRMIGPFKKLSTYYIGSAVKNDTVKVLDKFFTVQGFKGEATTLSNWNEGLGKWIGIKDSNALIMPGKGYRILMKLNDINYADSSGFMQLNGPPVIGDGKIPVNNAASFTIPITKSGGGWNFISNPYPCEIDWNASGWDKTNIEDAFYVWDGARKTYNVYKGAGGTGAPGIATTSMTSIINSGQGFMVKAKSAGNLSLNENVKVDTIQPSFFRMATVPLIRINLRNSEYNTDEAIIRFYEDATKEFDVEYDAMKYYGSTQNIATISGSDKLTVNTLPYYSTSLSVPIYVQAYTDGDFFLDFSEMESFPSEVNIYLKDNTLGTLTDIRKQFTYGFTGTSLNSSNRFELVFQKLPTAQVLAYENNNSDILETISVHPNPAEHNTSFSIRLQNPSSIDLMVQNLNGQVVYHAQMQGNTGMNVLDWQIQKENITSGIYYYKLKTEGRDFTGKLIVQ